MKIRAIASSILAAAILAGPTHAELRTGMDHHVRPMTGHVGQNYWHSRSRQTVSLAPRASYPFHKTHRRHEYQTHSHSYRRHYDSSRHHDGDRRHYGSHYDRHAARHHRHNDHPHRYKHDKHHERSKHDRHHDRNHHSRHDHGRHHGRKHDGHHDRYRKHLGHHRDHHGPRYVQDGLTLKLFSNGRVSAKVRLRSGEHWTRSNEHIVVHGDNRVIVYDAGLRLRGKRYVKRGSHLEIGTDRIVIKYGRYSDIYDYRLRLQKRKRDGYRYGLSLNLR